MNYLEIVKAARLLCGMQGIGPTSLANAQGVEQVLVRHVRDAYIDIQNTREEWDWLQRESTFSTTASKDTYTLSDIFAASSDTFKKFKNDSFIIESDKKKYLRFNDIDNLESKYLNSTDEAEPTEFTINPPDHSVVLKKTPDASYMISFKYWRSPEELTEDSQVPTLPQQFHNLIVYKATERMAVYLGAPDLYTRYSVEGNKLMGQLMRMEVPKMSFKPRPLV